MAKIIIQGQNIALGSLYGVNNNTTPVYIRTEWRRNLQDIASALNDLQTSVAAIQALQGVTSGTASTSTGVILGTVTSVSVLGANGVSGAVANSTTNAAITLSLGAITPTSVAASGNVTGANLSGNNTGNVTLTTTGSGPATLMGQALNIPTPSAGTVSTVSVVTANGLSGTVATASTTPAITLSLGAITPTSVAATGTATALNLSGINSGDVSLTTSGSGAATLTGQVLNIPIPANSEAIVSITPSINTKTVAATTIYTVPTGFTFYIRGAVITVSSSTGTGNGPGVDFYTSTAGDLMASTTMTTLNATGLDWNFQIVGLSKTVPAGGTVKFNVNTAATVTTQTVTVDLIGYLK